MTRLISQIAVKISRFLLESEYENLIASLESLTESVPTYSALENPNLSIAVQAAEDRQFKDHCGFHLRGIARAMYVYVTSKELQGASTVEQQLVRVIRNRREITVRRKLSEILLATSLGATFDKDTILELYMEVAYFGSRGTGITNICRRLKIELQSIGMNEACLLAALIKAPMPKKPTNKYNERLNRRIKYIHDYLCKTKLGLVK